MKSKPSVILCVLCVSVVSFFSCSSGPTKTKVDLIVHHAVVYTVDSAMTITEAFAVKAGRIVETGPNDSIFAKYESKDTLDASGKAIFPGFIDSHCHFYNYGLGLNKVDLVGTKSFDEVIQKVADYAKANPNAKWIVGRGWDQNDWEVKEFPNWNKLNELFPNTPVILKRIDGHAALANREAFRLAGIKGDTKVQGGEIFTEGKPKPGEVSAMIDFTGILIDNAVDLVEKVIPQPSKEEVIAALMNAQKNCFAVGLTTVDDAGLMKNVIDVMDELHKKNELKMRIYAMLSDSAPNYEHYMKSGPYKTERLNVRSFKFYGDGALGSRGACLLKPYADKPGWQGFLLKSPEYFRQKGQEMYAKGFQMNAHCIGDSSARLILNTYDRIFLADSGDDTIYFKNLRWRIEHFQVTTEKDLKFISGNELFVIPSIQPTHATSDMPWAEKRLGPERVKYAYAYKELLKAAGMVALGTDFPVEDISPFKTFYSAVYRTDAEGNPPGGWQMENALTREETLKGMTIWGAFANFEETEKGSIEKGKFADFVMLDTDIMTCSPGKILSTKVLCTYLNGELVYQIK